MKSRTSSPTMTMLALAVIFSLPALACSILTSNSPKLNNKDLETKMAANVEASLTANAETQVAQATITPPPSPTLPLQVEPTGIPSPNFTPAPTPTPVPVQSPVPSGIWVGQITFASDISQDNQPINPGTVFKQGITSIYAFIPYSGFEKGMKITLYWTLNGNEFVSAIHTWEWEPSGTYTPSTSYSNNHQLDSGNWMLTIFVNNKKMSSGTFKITP